MQKGFDMSLPALRSRDPCARTKGRPIGAQGSLQVTSSKEMGPSGLQLQENEFWQQLECAWKQILPRTSQ